MWDECNCARVKINLLLVIDICTSDVAICGLLSMIYLYKSLPLVHFWHHSFKLSSSKRNLEWTLWITTLWIKQTYVWIIPPTLLTHPRLTFHICKTTKVNGLWKLDKIMYTKHLAHLFDRMLLTNHYGLGILLGIRDRLFMRTCKIPTFLKNFILLKYSWFVIIQSLSCIRLCCNPIDCSLPTPLFLEFPRQEYWSGLLFLSPGDLNPGIKPTSFALQADFLPLSHQGRP